MGAENNTKEILVDSAKELAKEVYSDIAKSTIKSIGNIISLPFKAIDAALTPIKKWIDKKNFNYEKTRELLAEKLKNTNETQIVEPEAYVAVPALQQLSYSYDSEDLRQLYANLLASSMIEDTKWNVHPSFVEIIKQLSPADARAMNVINNPEYLTVMTLAIREIKTDTYINLIKNYSVDLIGLYPDDQQLSSSLENLQRLGLININYNVMVRPDSKYEPYETDPLFSKIRDYFKDNKENEMAYKKGLIELTDFGISFCKICCTKEDSEVKNA